MRASVGLCACLLLSAVCADERPATPAGPSADGPSVYVPYSEYRRLIAAGQPETASGPRSHLTSASLTVHVGTGALAVVTGVFRYRHVQSAPQLELTLLGGRTAVERVDSRPPGARVVARTGKGGPELALAVSPAVEGEVELRVKMPVERSGSSCWLSLTPQLSASCRLELDLPADASAVTVEPALSVDSAPSPGRVHAMVPHAPVRISWHSGRGDSTEPGAEPKAVDVSRQLTRFVLSSGSMSVFTRLTVEPSGSPVAALHLRLPGGRPDWVQASPGEHTWDATSGTLTIAFPEPLAGREQVSVEYRLPVAVPAPASLLLSAPFVADKPEPREAWLLLQSTDPIEVSVDPASLPPGTSIAAGRYPPELGSVRGASTRLALKYRQPDLAVRLKLDTWPLETSWATRPVAGSDLTAETLFSENRRAQTKLKLSVASGRAATCSFQFTGAATATFDAVSVDGHAEEPIRPLSSTRCTLLLKRPSGDASLHTVGLDFTVSQASLMWFGSIRLALPAPDFVVRGLSWKISAPPAYLFFSSCGSFDGGPALPSFFPYRFGAEVADLLAASLVWVGVPAVLLAFALLWLRRTPLGEQALSTAAGLASVAAAVVLAAAVYFLAAPVFRGALISRVGDPAVLPRSDREYPPALHGGHPESEPRLEEARSPLASAGPSAGPLDEGAHRVPAIPPDVVPTFLGPAGRGAGPAEGPSGPTAGRSDGEVSTGRLAELPTLVRALWLPAPAGSTMTAATSAAASTDPSRGRVTAPASGDAELQVNFQYLYRPMLPVLQGLSVVFGFVLFLALSMVAVEPARAGSNGALAAASFVLLWIVEA
ncbi:MAG: hypothetical protein HY303_04105, partial [Candidatus Wallbacteria bacterium]|nr:hypothetical protein [Candidatus Wallbacteria bacterium]